MELSAQAELQVRPPRGVKEIVATFGEIHDYIGADGQVDSRWAAKILGTVQLPFPLRLAWDQKTEIHKFSCHRKLTEGFGDVFEKLASERLQERVQYFGGCYAFRPQRGAGQLSAHAWGIAIDLNPETNRQGSAGDMDDGVVEVFRSLGFTWGGDWQGTRKDPMHFQFCTGY